MTANSSICIDFAACLAQYKVLSETRIRVDAELSQARHSLAEMVFVAERDFGTSDLLELRTILEQRMARNGELRKRFNQKMLEVEASLSSADGSRSCIDTPRSNRVAT